MRIAFPHINHSTFSCLAICVTLGLSSPVAAESGLWQSLDEDRGAETGAGQGLLARLVDLNEDGRQDILMHDPFALRDGHGTPLRPPDTEPHRVTILIAR